MPHLFELRPHLLLLLLSFAACRPSDALVVGKNVRLGPGRYTIGTVAVGDPVAALSRLTPSPGAQNDNEAALRFGRPGSDDEVIASASGGVVHTVWGRSVERDGVRLFTTQSDPAEVHRALGQGREERHHSPSSGVINTGYVATGGATWRYDAPGEKLELALTERGFGGFSLQLTR